MAPYFAGTKDGIAKDRQLCERALALDPKYVDAIWCIGFSYSTDVMSGYSLDPAHDLQRAYEFAKKGLALDDTIPENYYLLSAINFVWGQGAQALDDAKRYFAQAIDYAKRGIELDPSNPWGYSWLAYALIFSGKPAQGIEAAEKAIRVDPQNRDLYLDAVGDGYAAMARFGEAIASLRQNLVRYPNNLGSHIVLAICYAEIGQKEQARTEAAEVRRLNPKFSPKMMHPGLLNADKFPRVLADLRAAGLS